MKVTDILRFARERGEPVFSFEFFPPRTDEGERQLFRTVEALRPLGPAFVSVTYGAGGSDRQRTVDLVKRLKRDLEVEPVAHVTCVGSSREDVARVLDDVAGAGIQNVLLLRGDPPRGEGAFTPHPDGFAHASDLVAWVRESPDRWRFCVGAAAYPEGHPENRDLARDLAHLKVKVDAGVDFLVTQLFFDNAHYFRFVERARAAGIATPVLPGVMPLTSTDQIERFTAMCGASIPPPLRAAMDVRRADPDASLQLGVAWASLQCADLLRRGAPGIHFYTLNRSPSSRAILAALRASTPWRDLG
ncbi:MAG TPA: methylenetetrahydrofolate reductase [NAD(P)H] [Anaeromyxobacteraceae bacterium]|nr:methylenetetrahydrofolate reductase [NAD(P)H] [Anaeromyxobacteraceae bacterium]